MKHKLLFLLFLFPFLGFSQDNQLWRGYYSYNAINDVSSGATQVYAAAENTYFKKNISTNDVNTVSTIEGLSGQTISQIYHSEKFQKTLIGHVDGLLIIVNDVDGFVLNIVDILNKPSIPPNKKKINHFMEYNDKVYIATDFGIVVYDLKLLAFGDTYIIGPGGSNSEILQTTIYNGFIYAVSNGNGILKASASNQSLIDFNQWTTVTTTNANSIEKVNNELVAVSLTGTILKFVADIPTTVFTLPQIALDTRYDNGYLIITTQNHVYVYNDQLVEVSHINNIPNITTNFSCATIVKDKVYIGTMDKGLFSTTIINPTKFDNVTPNGPDKNRVFGIKLSANNLWAVYGDYSDSYNPYPLDQFAISKYGSDKSWKTIPYQELLGAKSISRVVVNPSNENQVYFSSHFSGLLKLENDVPTTLYNTSNSSLEKIDGSSDDIRVNGSAYDKNGNLWMTNAQVSKGLHVFKNNGQWEGYSLSCLQYPINNYGGIAIDKNGTKWIATAFDGLVGFNEAYGNRCISIRQGQGSGNLPINDVRVAAIDNKNKLWIGTKNGLRVLSSVDSFLTQSRLETNSIIILEEGLAQELLFDQFITDIVVDGANNKWIGTAGAGVFYISSDGQKTFHIFTKENSPLPSNVINDIEINSLTGEVLIATANGMVSYKGSATKGTENLNDVVVFPNPVRPEYSGLVSITGLMNKSNVKITDIEGNLVYEATSEGGTIQWDSDAFGKYKVTSGVYMVFVASEDGAETTVKKVMVVR
jgi:hypothetical protein